MKVKHFRNSFSQIRGLMFRKEKIIGVFYFLREQKISIHTWFCKYPLQLIFLDENKRFVESAYLVPFRNYTTRRRARYVIEIPLEGL